MILHSKQKEFVKTRARFKTCRAGRKGGKTAMEVEVLVYKATASTSRLNLSKKQFPTGRKVIYLAPTQIQARNIIWEALKNRLHGIGKPNEQMLQMKVPNEDGEVTTIYVGGWENRENYRGLTDVIHITFDEVDTLRNFFISWLEIFRPMFLDTSGTADFIGTPKKENPNLRRLEKDFQDKGDDFASFHFTSKDNPYLPISELESLEKEYQNDRNSYRQEILAEYVDDSGSLFKYNAIVDVFSNTVDKSSHNYMIIDVADDGSDKTKFSIWEGLTETHRFTFSRLNTEQIIEKAREYARDYKVPYSHIAVDAIGVGAGVASSSMLDGIIGYKSSYSSIKTDNNISILPDARRSVPMTTEYKNLRSQCVFYLADYVNNHKIASRVTGVDKENIIEELMVYQDASKGDGKRMVTMKEEVKEAIGRSPDDSDVWFMRMYFEIRAKMMPEYSAEYQNVVAEQANNFLRNRNRTGMNSAR